MNRRVLHLNLPDFPVALERIRDPALRLKPLIIALPHSRSRVQSASSEARSWGVNVGMQLSTAQRVCRDAAVLSPNPRLYAKAQSGIMNVLSHYTPVAEPEGYDKTYVDLSGTQRLLGPIRDTARTISREILRSFCLPSHLGLSVNKSTSAVASEVVDEDLLDVSPGCEAAFLAPQNAFLLPGVENVSIATIEELNIRIIRQFADTPVNRLALVFGRFATTLHWRAHGRDSRPVRPPEIKETIFEEAELAKDTNNRDELMTILYGLVERCGFRVRGEGKAARTAELVVAYCDNLLVEGKARLAPPSDRDEDLFNAARTIFRREVKRRVRVSYVKILFCDLGPSRIQKSLFPDIQSVHEKEASITRAMDDIRRKYGVNSIRKMGMACPVLST